MTTSPYPIRPLAPDEFDEAHGVVEEAFGEDLGADHRQQLRRRYEFDRSLAAFDADRVVGLAVSYRLRMSVPGGMQPVAGVTGVVVLPTHRRRGLLRALMVRQLADLHERGEPVAALIASESSLYGRFGYGPASRAASVRLRRGEGAFREDIATDLAEATGLRLHRGDPGPFRPWLTEVYRRHVPARPGEWLRTDAWWDRRLADDEYAREGGGKLRCAVVERTGEPLGYALFNIRTDWSDFGNPNHELRVREIVGIEPAAYALLWRHLLDNDLVGVVTADDRPPDDPLFSLLADPRRARVTLADGLWVRLVDIGPALAGRAYARPVDVVLEVSDPVCPWNAGRWRLSGDENGASCERTTDRPDIALATRDLASGFLGDRGLAAPAAAGLVHEMRPGALRSLSAALAWFPGPHCSMDF